MFNATVLVSSTLEPLHPQWISSHRRYETRASLSYVRALDKNKHTTTFDKLEEGNSYTNLDLQSQNGPFN